MRVFNNREGFTAKDDSLPGRLFEPLVTDPTDKKKFDRATFDRELEIYYKYAGIEKDTGRPNREMIQTLNLNEISDMLE